MPASAQSAIPTSAAASAMIVGVPSSMRAMSARGRNSGPIANWSSVA
ncbi:MAG: hypothetical protein RJA49_2998, partial [Actinomycetota bacterium]